MSKLHMLIAAAILAASPLASQAQMDHSKMGGMEMGVSPDPPMTDGEVRKVDKDAGKLTLKHGEIKNLDMPPMTMVFQVKDKAMLDMVKVGDKVRFKAVDDGGKMVVTELQAAP
jgi:Cu(I)/Ag(I) efflux system periplasmic protein CusF